MKGERNAGSYHGTFFPTYNNPIPKVKGLSHTLTASPAGKVGQRMRKREQEVGFFPAKIMGLHTYFYKKDLRESKKLHRWIRSILFDVRRS